MKKWLDKFKNKEWVQDILVEIVGDVLMICLGLVGAYYIKIFLM